jgi:hypothetical protein
MSMQFIRAIVGAITESIASLANKKSSFRVDPTLPHGTPFSFSPASVDIHRAIGDETELKGFVCAKCNRKVIGFHFSVRFDYKLRIYGIKRFIAKTELEARQRAKKLIASGGIIGINELEEEVRAMPGVIIFSVTQQDEAYEDELDNSLIPF